MPGPDREDPEGAAFVSRLRSGREGALAEFVENHRGGLYRLAFRLSGSHADADDLVQETFLRAMRGLDGFRGEAALGTWLYRIVVNLSVNRLKSASVTRRDRRRAEEIPVAVDSAAEGDLVARERAEMIRRVVSTLPPKQREVLVLHVYEEWTFPRIAEALGCPVGTAKANFFHAVGNLRKRLGTGGSRKQSGARTGSDPVGVTGFHPSAAPSPRESDPPPAGAGETGTERVRRRDSR